MVLDGFAKRVGLLVLAAGLALGGVAASQELKAGDQAQQRPQTQVETRPQQRPAQRQAPVIAAPSKGEPEASPPKAVATKQEANGPNWTDVVNVVVGLIMLLFTWRLTRVTEAQHVLETNLAKDAEQQRADVKASIAQATRAATAMERLAKSTAETVEATESVASGTALTGAATAASANAMEQAAKAMERAADAAVEANRMHVESFVIDQRPWVYPRVVPWTALKFTDRGVSLTVKIEMTNPGRHHALEAAPRAYLMLGDGKGRDLKKLAKIGASCLKERENPNRIAEAAIFPNDPLIKFQVASVTHEELAANKVFQRLGVIVLNLGLCVSYRSPLDNEIHQTLVLYDVLGVGPGGQAQAIKPSEGDLLPSKLMFSQVSAEAS